MPQGRTALLLFVQEAELCAGTVEHRWDGRVVRQLPNQPQPGQLVSVICRIMEGQGLDDVLYVVIDRDAYWPDAFPAIFKKNSNT